MRIKIYLDSNINIDETYYREVSNISNAKIIFTKDVNFSKTINNQDTCLVICLSKDNYALPSSNGEKIYFWMIKESEFAKINNAIIDRFYKIKYINYWTLYHSTEWKASEKKKAEDRKPIFGIMD